MPSEQFAPFHVKFVLAFVAPTSTRHSLPHAFLLTELITSVKLLASPDTVLHVGHS